MTKNKRRLLLVEDEFAIADVLVEYIRHAGYEPIHIADGCAALEEIRRNPPDLVLLDIMLPGMDGMTVCREVRRFSTVPIVMLTARAEEIDRLLGLQIGADDYICKPFSPREVIARITSLLRRIEWSSASQDTSQRKELVKIDEDRHEIKIDNINLPLTPTEFRILKVLVSNPGRIYSRSQLLDLAYDVNNDVSDRIIDSHIKNLRRKTIAALPEKEVIHSVYGIGYRFEI